MKIYLAGPVAGLVDYNFEAFTTATKNLRAQGHEVFNPLEHELSQDIQSGKNTRPGAFRECLAIDLDYICNEAEAIAFLPNWEYSLGSAAEFHTAKACGIAFMYLTANLELKEGF